MNIGRSLLNSIRKSESRLCVVAGLSAALLLAGCSANEEVVDNSPLVPAAIVKSRFDNNGFKGFLASAGDRTEVTMPMIQRVDERGKFTGMIMSRIGGKRDDSTIARVDRNLVWRMDNRKKRYFECPLSGCPVGTIYDADQEVFGGDSEGEDGQAIEGCDVAITNNKLQLDNTGERRDINGFPAEKHVLEWKIDAVDDQGQTASNRVAFDFWVTPETGEILELKRIRETYADNYRRAVQAGRPDMSPVGSEEALRRMLVLLFAGLDTDEIERLLAPWKNMRWPEGFTVSSKIQWDSRNETCAAPQEPEQENERRLDTGSLGGLLKSVGKQIVDQEVDKRAEAKRREIELAPVFSHTEEILSIEIGQVRESRLSVPSNYQLRNRR